MTLLKPPTGHVFRVERTRGAVWYAKYRLPDGRQVQRKIGPAWSERGRPPAGYLTKRLAEDWLRDVIDQARRGTLPGMLRTGATFADAAAEWLRYIEHDRGRKPSTLHGYRSTLNAHLLPAFGSMAVEDVTTEAIERWITAFQGSIRMRNKLVIQLHGILARAKKVYGLSANAATEVEKFPQRRAGDIDVFSPEEVWALVRAAGANAQDGAIYLTAAFTGLRMGELLALCWRDVDFTGSVIRVRASYYLGSLTTPKSGKVRAVPMAPDVASALAQLGQRSDWVGDDDLVFIGEAGGYLDGSALRRRYKSALAAAGLRPLRFHDLRHTFGTLMIAEADIRRVQEWMGHADVQTTMRYLHYAPRADDAALVAKAFAVRDDLGRLGTSRDDFTSQARG
ncbi:MAG TPA: site-specific integrase [Solirubrobacteraceae bacterium]|nr:site-specific integrase [Solirubrobacteraceae bacterium]